jgi:hypothetical protein
MLFCHLIVTQGVRFFYQFIFFLSWNLRLTSEYNNKYIISVGSVGINFNGNQSAQFVVLDYSDKLSIELKEIKYNLNLLKRGKEDKNDWVNICIKGIETGKDLNKEFLEELKLKTNKWPVSNKIWDKQYKEWQRNGKIL